jgi:hypothetical protein
MSGVRSEGREIAGKKGGKLRMSYERKKYRSTYIAVNQRNTSLYPLISRTCTKNGRFLRVWTESTWPGSLQQAQAVGTPAVSTLMKNQWQLVLRILGICCHVIIFIFKRTVTQD